MPELMVKTDPPFPVPLNTGSPRRAKSPHNRGWEGHAATDVSRKMRISVSEDTMESSKRPDCGSTRTNGACKERTVTTTIGGPRGEKLHILTSLRGHDDSIPSLVRVVVTSQSITRSGR